MRLSACSTRIGLYTYKKSIRYSIFYFPFFFNKKKKSREAERPLPQDEGGETGAPIETAALRPPPAPAGRVPAPAPHVPCGLPPDHHKVRERVDGVRLGRWAPP